MCWHKSELTKVHEVFAQTTRDNFFSMNRQGQKLGLGKAQITIKRGQEVLTQITRNNFFL